MAGDQLRHWAHDRPWQRRLRLRDDRAAAAAGTLRAQQHGDASIRRYEGRWGRRHLPADKRGYAAWWIW